LNTFGIGSGADSHLVEGVARAGFGSYSFLDDAEDPKAKVMATRAINHLPVRKIEALRAFDKDGGEIIDLLHDSKTKKLFQKQNYITNGNEFNLSLVLHGEEYQNIHHLMLEVYNPNSDLIELSPKIVVR